MPPHRSLQQSHDLLCAPGQLHELETRLIDGQLLRVYKNLWPSLRVFWLWAANEHKDAPYAVFERQRHTFSQVFARSLKAAAMFRDVYGVRKGDRVAICARNYPEYIVAFWATHLLGAISALPNAWSPLLTLQHCIVHTQAKLVIVDSERADVLESVAPTLLAEAGATGMLVIEPQEGKGVWQSMTTWGDALAAYKGDPLSVISTDPGIVAEDDATILFTSGTTGMPKGVLSTQRQFLTNILNVLVAARRAALRRGEDMPAPPTGPQRGILLSVPLFHVTGLTSLTMLATLAGSKWTQTELDNLEKSLKEHEAWLSEWVEKQKSVKSNEDPVIETAEMKARAKALEIHLQKLYKRKIPKAVKKPKPKPTTTVEEVPLETEAATPEEGESPVEEEPVVTPPQEGEQVPLKEEEQKHDEL